ncbi:acyltransferase family protein [Dryocola sp. BD586]|uniref:acyltransferase family protein n=1 Tax=Dryocola sp. BD586 TaxID=3133271 RepID=UPI003F50C792
MSQRNELYGLTIFRFIAAFYVFIFHCNLRYPADVSIWLAAIFKNGAIGMSFFFILSGFVMAWAYQDGIRENYLKSRIARIYPAYIAMGIISLPFIFSYDLAKITTYIFLYLTASQSWIPSSFSIWHFSGSWSVSTEMFFYITFPLLLPLIKRNPFLSIFIAYVATSLMVPLTMNINDRGWFPLLYIGPMYRLPEFVIGVALGCIYSSGLRLKKSLPILTPVAILVLLILSPVDNIGWVKNNFITVPATAVLIYCIACMDIANTRIAKPFIYLGKISYSFYLMQLPVMIYITNNHSILESMATWQAWLIIGIINILMASACYHIVENNVKVKAFILKAKPIKL